MLAALPAFAAEEARVELRSTITGNQEQPKVLYIVPWQAPGGADHLAQPLQPMLQDVFATVDRAEFRRELRYREEASKFDVETGAIGTPVSPAR
jgi:hypothetical protein